MVVMIFGTGNIDGVTETSTNKFEDFLWLLYKIDSSWFFQNIG